MGMTTRFAAITGTITIAAVAALSLLSTPAAAQEAGASPRDDDITTAVLNTLTLDEGVPEHRIRAATEAGIVTLTGSVSNILAKSRAERLVETVRGVRGVENRIEVRGPARPDAEIRTDVAAALAAEPALPEGNIRVAVEDGAVTLSGAVDSRQRGNLAARTAMGVRGVRRVENRLALSIDTAFGDQEIRRNIRSAIRWDALVDGGQIRVAVDDGRVVLTGAVPSAAEKSRAFELAWVSGVEDVDAQGLEVEERNPREEYRGSKYEGVTDQGITAAVEDRLGNDPRVADAPVDVRVDSGVVNLQGQVATLKAKRAADRAAGAIVGGWRVKNYISVRPGASDPELLAVLVEKALARDPYVEGYQIDVGVRNGRVSLSGEVGTLFEKGRADEVASRVPGVGEVKNHLRVADSGYQQRYEPYADADWYVDADWFSRSGAVPKEDWEILEDVRDEFRWSPFIDADAIDLVVEDGTVTLIGVVGTLRERRLARENAFQAGAVAVKNELKVRRGPEYYRP